MTGYLKSKFMLAFLPERHSKFLPMVLVNFLLLSSSELSTFRVTGQTLKWNFVSTIFSLQFLFLLGICIRCNLRPWDANEDHKGTGVMNTGWHSNPQPSDAEESHGNTWYRRPHGSVATFKCVLCVYSCVVQWESGIICCCLLIGIPLPSLFFSFHTWVSWLKKKTIPFGCLYYTQEFSL